MLTKNHSIVHIICFEMILLFSSSISAGTIIVDASGNGDYITITDGMTASSSGDTVYVMPGTYYEHGIRMKENVVLQGAGADKCIIDGGDKHLGWPDNTVIFFDSVKAGKIGGFSINYKLGSGIAIIQSWPIIFWRPGSGWKVYEAGIALNQSTPIISNNRIINSGCGIYYLGSHPIECYSLINGNTITNNRVGLYFMLDGIDYSKVDTIDVSNNWWGTTVESEIQEGIQIDPSLINFHILYKPWLIEPVDSLIQIKEGFHWNNIYNNKEVNVAIADASSPVKKKSISSTLPEQVTLFQNYPNPFNLTTTIKYQLSNHIPTNTNLKIYNLIGEEVRTLVKSLQKEGEYQVIWDGKNDKGKEVSSGIYFCILKSGCFIVSNKLLLVK